MIESKLIAVVAAGDAYQWQSEEEGEFGEDGSVQ